MPHHQLLYGEESFLIEQHLKAFAKTHHISKWTSLSETTSLEDLYMALQSVDMFSPQKWVVMKNPWFFKKKPTDKEQSALNAFFLELPQMQNTLVLVHQGSLDKRLTVTKKAMAALDVHEYKAFQEWEADKVKQWASGYAKAMQIAIAPDALHYLVTLHGVNIQQTAQDLQKLHLYTSSQQAITLADVKVMCSSGQATLYDLNEALKNKEGKRCYALLYKLLQQGEDPVKILGYLASSIRLFLQIKLLEQERIPQSEMGKLTGKNPYFIQLLSQAIRQKYSIPVLKQSLTHLAVCDVLIKSGKQNPKTALQLAVYKVLAAK